MHKRNQAACFDIKQIFIDVLVIALCYFLSSLVYRLVRQEILAWHHLWIPFIFAVVFVLAMTFLRMYHLSTFYYWNRIILRTLAASVIAALCVTMAIFLGKAVYASRLWFTMFCLACLVAVVAERFVVRKFRRSYVGNGYSRVIFVGDAESAARYRHFVSQTAYKIELVCQLEYSSPAVKTPLAFEQMLKEQKIDEVVFVRNAYRPDPVDLQKYLTVCDEMGITGRLLLNTYELPNSKCYISSLGTYPLLTYHSVSLDRVQLFVKSAMDIVCSLLALVILSPVWLATAIAIKLDSPGPVLFRQQRVGTNGKVFTMYKFRSMHNDAEARKKELVNRNRVTSGLMFKVYQDPRVTRVGRFIRRTSIDEIPQLLNVLKGDMSIVGTRPPTCDEVEKYHRHHWRRISIKPGITGMWQVSGRSNIIDFEKVLELDNHYIDQWSIGLDCKLMLKTLSVVLHCIGAR